MGLQTPPPTAAPTYASGAAGSGVLAGLAAANALLLQGQQVVGGLSPQQANTSAFAAAFQRSVVAAVNATAPVAYFVVQTVRAAPAKPSPAPASRRSLLRVLTGLLPPSSGSSGGSGVAAAQQAVSVVYLLAVTAGHDVAGVSTALYSAVATGSFTNALRANGFPAAVVNTLPTLSVVPLMPAVGLTAAPSSAGGQLSIGPIMGIVGGSLVAGYILWAYARHLRRKEEEARQRFATTENPDAGAVCVRKVEYGAPAAAAAAALLPPLPFPPPPPTNLRGSGEVVFL